MQELRRKIELYPLRMVKDFGERTALCERFYNELVLSLNQIDRRTITSVFSELCNSSQAIQDAQASVHRSYSDQNKSSKREHGASSSSNSSSRARNTHSSSTLYSYTYTFGSVATISR